MNRLHQLFVVGLLEDCSRSLRPVILLACAFLALSCERKQPAPTAGAQGTGATGRTLVVGLIPEQNIFNQIDRYQPIADYLGARTGVTLQLTVLPRYGNIVDNFVSARMDGAFFGSFTYALAHRRLGVEVLARPLWQSGKSTYRGLVFVRSDSGITAVAQMQGKRLALVDKATTAGFLVPIEMFAKAGKDHRTWLKETYFAGTHEAAIRDVLDGKADIGAAKDTVFDRLRESEPRVGAELTVLLTSPEVPENGLAVRRDLDAELKRKLAAALLGMHEDPDGRARLEKFGALRFIATRDEDYRVVYQHAAEAKLDLATYDYLND